MTTQHPDDKFLQLYVAARLDEEKEKIIEKHLARCPQCTKRVSELEQLLQNHDPLMQKFKELAVSDDDDSSEMAIPGTRLSQVNQSVQNVILQGDILGGNLRLEEKLGRGGMGETWKAFDQTAERHVVLKFVPGEMQHLKEAMESVRSSFQKIHALQHQHICPVYNLVDDPKHGLYIVMKYIDGLTLSEYRRRLSDRNKKMSFNDIVQILWAVAKGLDYAHERKVIHRDIKPGNIMIGRKDGVQIIDFGLAEEIRTLLSQTSDAEVMSSSGTRPYMAPEQWQGRIQDARTDQYTLAVTAYELFAGHVPFSGNDVELLKNTVLNDSPEAIASLPEYVNTALLKALSKKRDERYENCKAFVKALITKPESPDFVEVEERKFPEGAVTINDLPSDKGSGGNVAPVWLPDGLSTSPSTSSTGSKPPIIAISTSSSKKNGLPSWVMPTISALAMLVVCMACFLGYTMMDRQTKPQDQSVVAKKPENVVEPIVEPVPVPLEEETSEAVSADLRENISDNPMPEVVAEANQASSEANSEEDSDFTISLPAPESQPQTNVQPEPVRLTLEPVEATEIRQQYDETVEQAIKPYREELEKELALAKKNGILNLVLALETELKHLASDERTAITPFKPEKRTLFNAKVRFKKKIETALEDYQKKLDSLVKELVRTERTEEAKIVQELLDHSVHSKAILSTPKRAPRPLAPTVRLTLEILEDGKGRFIAERGKTTDLPKDDFRGTIFPLTGFPKVQAFRGENSMGRLLLDMADTASSKEWKASNLFHRRGVEFVPEKSMLQVVSDVIQPQTWFSKNKLSVPCCMTGEIILPTLEGHWSTKICFRLPDDRESVVNCWCGFGEDNHIWGYGYYSLPGETKRHDLVKAGSKNGFVREFQLPKEMRLDQSRITLMSLGFAEIKNNPNHLQSGLSLIDLVAKFSASVGLEIESNDKTTIVSRVADKGAAFRSGVKEGDVIVRFNGVKRTTEQIQKILDNVRFGDLVTIAVLRDGEEKVFRFHAE